jgi:hypothetical protein
LTRTSVARLSVLTVSNDYISFWNLRSYDRINAPKGYIQKMEAASGVNMHEAQVAMARVFVGQPGEEMDDDAVVFIEKPHDQLTEAEDTNKKKKTAQDAVPLPKTVEEVSFAAKYYVADPQAIAIVEKFESGAPRDDTVVSDNSECSGLAHADVQSARTPSSPACRSARSPGWAPRRRSATPSSPSCSTSTARL